MLFNKTMKEQTAKIEGGYVNNKNDSGGETYKGVSRNNNKLWGGWFIIDKLKTDLRAKNTPITRANMNNALQGNEALDNMVLDLYRQNYWNPYNKLNLSGQIHSKLFDMGVNMGVGRAIGMLQGALLGLGAFLGNTGRNRNGVDNLIGSKTIQACREFATNANTNKIIDSLIKQQKNFYQNVFFKGQPYWGKGKVGESFMRRAEFKGCVND